MSIFKKYLSDTSGNFAIMFGLGAAMLVSGVAIAVDTAGMINARQSLQNYIDSAALSAVIEVATNSEIRANENSAVHKRQYEDAVNSILAATDVDLKGTTPTITLDQSSLIVEVDVPYTLSFGALLNKKTTSINALSMVSLPTSGQPVEIALVLDNTESMNPNGKLTALREGANEFIDAIEESNSGTKIAIVPFARYVDVGEDKRGEPWLEVPAEYDTNRTWQQATHTGGTCQLETRTTWRDGFEEEYETNVCTGQTTTYETKSKVIESRWIGCVGVRSNELHMTDGPYTSTPTRVQGLLHKMPHEVTGLSWDVESWCPRKITPLTDDFDLLRSEIAWLYGTDSTYIPMGLTWGRRVLSPDLPFAETDTVNPKKKIMVLMTDGKNSSLLDTSSVAVNDHNAPPYVRDFNQQEQEDGVIPVQANADSAALCETIKSEGIELYTIAFQVTDPLTLSMLQTCASTGRHYFNSDSNEALVETFREISTGLGGDIRLMR